MAHLRIAVASAALVAAAATGATAGAAPAAVRTTGPDPYVIITTTVTDTAIHLSKKATHGVHYIAFMVTNRGRKPHVFAVGKVHTRVLVPGEKQHLVSFFPDYGKYSYSCRLHCAVRGVITVGR